MSPALAFALLLLPAQPATIACVGDSLQAADRNAIIRSAGEMVADKNSARIAPAQKAAVAKAAAACAKRHGWPAQNAEAASVYALSTLARGPIDAAIRRTGNDPHRWEAALRALPEETRLGVGLRRDDAVADYARGLAGAGKPLDVQSARLAGVFAGMVLVQDMARERFAAR